MVINRLIDRISDDLRLAKADGFTFATWCSACSHVVVSRTPEYKGQKDTTRVIFHSDRDCRQTTAHGSLNECLDALKDFA